MRWLRKVSTPFRRVWKAIFAKLRPRKHKRGSGMGKLYNDVLSCGYDDVHTMWTILHETHAPVDSPKKHRPTVSFG
uniref:Uncharacterized protein n=1 Tax=Physcomitrium patens TaxID=3218 RepID=A0A2K1KNR2_PHYPA|nr:hypothetical protein PHYPA_006307 [Physcomitrium patens]